LRENKKEFVDTIVLNNMVLKLQGKIGIVSMEERDGTWIVKIEIPHGSVFAKALFNSLVGKKK